MQVQSLNLNVEIYGEGDPVVLLHGWGGSVDSMRPTAQLLAQSGFRAYVLDLPGFGKSQLPPQAWNVPRYAEFVRAYLDTAELENVYLIGHSFGGRISLVMGAEYPERINKIVLVDSAGVRPQPSGNMRFYYLGRKIIFIILKLPGLKRFEPDVRAYLRQKFGSSDYLNAGPLEETFKLVVNQDLVPYARRIKVPTLLIWGENDLDTPIAQAKILEQAIPDAGLVVFENAGHFSYLDHPTHFNHIVTTFFRGQ